LQVTPTRLQPDRLDVTYRLYSAKDTATANENTPVEFDIAMVASFAVQPDTQLEQLTAFAHHGGLLVAWPYLREALSTLTAKLGLPPLLLPLLTVPVAAPDAQQPKLTSKV
jgi:preprotein translocase subunit SecB